MSKVVCPLEHLVHCIYIWFDNVFNHVNFVNESIVRERLECQLLSLLIDLCIREISEIVCSAHELLNPVMFF